MGSDYFIRDNNDGSNVSMVPLVDGSPIWGGLGTMCGSCAVASLWPAGESVVASWPSVGTMGDGSAVTSSLSSVAGTADGSTFVSWSTG
jgi:hypothetical protein